MALDLQSLLSQIDAFEKAAQQEIEAVTDLEALEHLRVNSLGKKGRLTQLLKELGSLSAEDKPKAGSRANEVRNAIHNRLEELSLQLKSKELNKQLETERVDVTLPGRELPSYFEHPVQMVQQELVSILERCGFGVEIGPELEHEFYNFDALNMPPNHPARAMQDTFYVKDHPEALLRTQTSPVQIRTMLLQKPPIRMISPGRVYRADYDATHSPMFHQVEALLVDQHVHMGHLKGILSVLIQEFFGASLALRLRPSFFPFTEPSAEVDMQCCFCSGKGCATCKGSGWVEIGGCGMVDPEVFKAVNLDPEVHRGFAFGMGIERMAMLKYGIHDLRAFFESDHRFISQFARWRP